jgi:predicted adenylyl cyclase CyaB
LGAEAGGMLSQRDTYFHVPRGRLKLREEEGAAAHLIAYERPDLAGQRESRYRIVDVEQPDELVAALSSVLGVKVVIAKERRLFLWKGVRIHLDKVDGLGDFIELEAVAPADSNLSHEEMQVKTLRQALEIDDADVIGVSYCDLALAGNGVAINP